MLYKTLIRPILYRFDAEKVHYFVANTLKNVFKIPFAKSISKLVFQVESHKLERELFGLKFKNPVGLAAGFDKNALLIDEMAALGFGFVEIGTLTPRPQVGNEKPRLFRLPKNEALINRMGFNNEGVLEAIRHLKNRQSDVLVGGNIGKNKLTPNDEAVYDYLYCFEKLYDFVDYFVVNVSSPNTPNLRDLQEKEPLTYLLKELQKANQKKVKQKPILLKIAPDLTDSQLDDIIDIVKITEIAGVISTNTTISRANLESELSEIETIGAGGLSGKPLGKRSTEVIRYLHTQSKGAFPIIGVGGIHTPEDAQEKLAAGASLVQLYSGFIYEGPSLIKEICKHIAKKS